MEGPTHDLNALCQQLGLPSETEALQAFISQHSPLAEAIELADAPFWSASQASFLREQLNCGRRCSGRGRRSTGRKNRRRQRHL